MKNQLLILASMCIVNVCVLPVPDEEVAIQPDADIKTNSLGKIIQNYPAELPTPIKLEEEVKPLYKPLETSTTTNVEFSTVASLLPSKSIVTTNLDLHAPDLETAPTIAQRMLYNSETPIKEISTIEEGGIKLGTKVTYKKGSHKANETSRAIPLIESSIFDFDMSQDADFEHKPVSAAEITKSKNEEIELHTSTTRFKEPKIELKSVEPEISISSYSNESNSEIKQFPHQENSNGIMQEEKAAHGHVPMNETQIIDDKHENNAQVITPDDIKNTFNMKSKQTKSAESVAELTATLEAQENTTNQIYSNFKISVEDISALVSPNAVEDGSQENCTDY